jgi:hypothetical protein
MDNHTLTHQIRGGRTNSLNRRLLSTIGMRLIFTGMLLSGSMPGMFPTRRQSSYCADQSRLWAKRIYR